MSDERSSMNSKNVWGILGVLCVLADPIMGQCLQGELRNNSSLQCSPQVVGTVPEMGAVGVPSTLRELVVKFDRDMSPGYSFVGGGPTFPTITGKGEWRTSQECVLPVQLEPNRTYTVGLNSQDRFMNFMSAWGVPLEPVVWRFSTLS